jgi:excisionase family DNA binding protein
MTDEPPVRLTLREAAERAHLSVATIRRRIANGELPCYKIAGIAKHVVLQHDVDRVFALEPTEPRSERPHAPRRGSSKAADTGPGSRAALQAIEAEDDGTRKRRGT